MTRKQRRLTLIATAGVVLAVALTVDSPVGGGTAVEAEIPLDTKTPGIHSKP